MFSESSETSRNKQTKSLDEHPTKIFRKKNCTNILKTLLKANERSINVCSQC